jgi:hypothetical protein
MLAVLKTDDERSPVKLAEDTNALINVTWQCGPHASVEERNTSMERMVRPITVTTGNKQPSKHLVGFQSSENDLTIIGLNISGASKDVRTDPDILYTIRGLPKSTTFQLLLWNARGRWRSHSSRHASHFERWRRGAGGRAHAERLRIDHQEAAREALLSLGSGSPNYVPRLVGVQDDALQHRSPACRKMFHIEGA